MLKKYHMKKLFFILLFQLAVINIYCQTVNVTDVPLVSTTNYTESENSVFISPLNPAYVLSANNRIGLPFIQCGTSPCDVDAFESTTNGGSWSSPTTMLNSSADPSAIIGRSGRYFVCDMDKNNGIRISYSDDYGVTWNQSTIATSTTLLDKDHAWIDNKIYNSGGTTNTYQGNIYSAWTKFGSTPSNLFLSRSTNGGTAWSTTPVNISSGTSSLFMDQGVNLQTGPNGEVYACWAVYDFWGNSSEGAIGFNSSSDGGVTWGTAYRAINNIKGIRASAGGVLGGGKSMTTNSFPSMTVNEQNGNMFIVWTNQGVPCGSNNPTGCNTGDADIYMIRMINGQGGCCWSDPIRVNQDAIGNGKDQWFPWISCDEASGALVCTYYDSRDFTNNDQANTYVSISYDQGGTWTDYKISDVPWNADGGPIGTYAGDYIGVDVYHGYAVPIWTDTRTSGTLLSYTNPFQLPCPTTLSLCNASIVDNVAYKTSSTIYVAGGTECFYTILPVGNVIMQAVNEITFDAGFESDGELYAYTDPTCTSFSQRMGTENSSASSDWISSPVPIMPTVISQNSSASIMRLDEQTTPHVFPNPSSDGKINFTLPPVSNQDVKTISALVKIFIYNSYGKLVYQMQTTENSSNSEIDLSQQAKGLYLVKFVKEDKIYTEKIIVQ